MNILVTGANGFLGKNLIAQLRNEGFEDTQTYTLANNLEELAEFTRKCDFVFHLAGVNRPRHTEEFFKGNTDLTENLLSALEKNENKAPIVITSSIQASLDNPYGQSKKQAEELVFNYAERNQTKAYVYQLPNLFGKWSKPNYNSVVATFCYNVSRGIPIKVDNPENEMTLCYVDDVVSEFIKVLKNGPIEEETYCKVPVEYQVTVGELAEKIQSFKENRVTLKMPSLREQFDRDLYGTYLSYLEEDDFSYKLKKNTDDRGWLAEFIKSEDSGQIFISTTKPGITRGNHWHHTKVEKFLVIQGKAAIRFRNINSDEVIEYIVDAEELEVVDIPVGYTHSITNICDEDIITLFWACEIFDSNNPDTYYVEV